MSLGLGAALPPASCLLPMDFLLCLKAFFFFFFLLVLLKTQMPPETDNCLFLSVKDVLVGESLSDVPEE